MLQARKADIPRRQAAPPQQVCVPDHSIKSRRAPGKRVLLLLVACACFLLGLAIVVQYSYSVVLHRQLQRAEARLAGLGEEYRELELEAARLASLSRIESVARLELGMGEPAQGQLKVLTAGQEDGDR